MDLVFMSSILYMYVKTLVPEIQITLLHGPENSHLKYQLYVNKLINKMTFWYIIMVSISV